MPFVARSEPQWALLGRGNKIDARGIQFDVAENRPDSVTGQ